MPTLVHGQMRQVTHYAPADRERDLAELYSVDTKTLVRAVKRNIDRFPEDFMFQLTKDEYANLRY